MSEERKEKHILFYSRECQYSNKIIKRIQEYPELNVIFRKLSVEDIVNQGGRLPNNLQAVPAVLIDGQQLIQGQQAFSWLQTEVKSFLTGQGISAGNEDLGYSFVDGSSSSSVNTNNFSSVENPGTFTDQVASMQNTSSGGGTVDLARLQQERNSGINIQRGPAPAQENVQRGGGSNDFSQIQQQRNSGYNIQRGPGPQTTNIDSFQNKKEDEMNSRMQQMQEQRSFNVPGGGGRPADIDFSLPM
jgi:hypothetical protein